MIVDADRLAREAVAPRTEGLREVIATFGEEMLDADGALDRGALGARVFADEGARRRLENIIHPWVRARTGELISAAAPEAIVVNDVPLLVESGLAPTYHLVLVVETSEATRIARLARDRGMTEDEAYARIRAQASDERRRAAADVVLPNDGALDDLHERVDRLWCERLVPYEENVRLRRPAWHDGEAPVVPYDPTWPEQYARLAARICHATGVGRVEHVGPTAVPDGPAPDVIDVQLIVDSLAEADRIAGALADAGFPRADDLPETDGSTGAGGFPGADGGERRHGGADPGRRVSLRLRGEAGNCGG